MAELSKQQIIAMLNEDLKGEHMAIIQYLRHAYRMGEGELACEIEAIAREEMYHFHWLAELIVELGGKPTIERNNLDLGGSAAADWMARDVRAEQEAIALYKKHISLIDDPKIVRVLKRILSDELVHEQDFAKFVEEAKAEMPAPDVPPAAPTPDDRLVGILNQGVRHEYTVTLQYLYHSHMTPNREVGEELHWQAVNEMQHMGWLSEAVMEMGADADMEHTEVDLSEDTAEMLKADIEAERAVILDYNTQVKEVQDEEIKGLLARIRDHEVYHEELFSEMLEGLEDESAASEQDKPQPEDKSSEIPTVGSLINT